MSDKEQYIEGSIQLQGSLPYTDINIEYRRKCDEAASQRRNTFNWKRSLASLSVVCFVGIVVSALILTKTPDVRSFRASPARDTSKTDISLIKQEEGNYYKNYYEIDNNGIMPPMAPPILNATQDQLGDYNISSIKLN